MSIQEKIDYKLGNLESPMVIKNSSSTSPPAYNFLVVEGEIHGAVTAAV